MQCFPRGTQVHHANLGAAYERWHQGPVQHFALADGTQMVCTRNHPVVTHLGWKSAWEVRPNWLLLTVDSEEEPRSIESVFDDAAANGVAHALPGSVRDFHGDGDNGIVRCVSAGGALADQPWHSSEGTVPARHTATHLYEVLALTIQPNALGYTNWSEVRRHVPDVDKMWPGRPYAMDEGLGGAVAAELPPPVVDHDVWAKRIVGVGGRLSLKRVDQTWTGVVGGYVYNMSTATGAYLADSVVVGNCG